MGVVTLQHGQQVALENSEHSIEILLKQGPVHHAQGRMALIGFSLHIVGEQALQKADAYLIIR